MCRHSHRRWQATNVTHPTNPTQRQADTTQADTTTTRTHYVQLERENRVSDRRGRCDTVRACTSNGMVNLFIGYGMGFYGLSKYPSDDAIRTWQIPYDWTIWETLALFVLDPEEMLEILSTLVDISSN